MLNDVTVILIYSHFIVYRTENGKLWAEINALKTRLEEEMIKNQMLEDQRRQFSLQVETLQAKLNSMEVRIVSFMLLKIQIFLQLVTLRMCFIF